MNLLSLMSSNTRRFTSEGISLYLVPHQDDEIGTYGAAILEEVAAGKVVHLLLTTRGETSGARTNPTMATRIGYTPSEEEFSAKRDQEFVEAARRLGAVPIIPAYGVRTSDGGGSMEHVIGLIKSYYPNLDSVSLRSMAPTDFHVDHSATGQAVVQLADEGEGLDHRLFVSPQRMADYWPPSNPPKNKMGKHGDLRPYHFWPYTYIDVPNGWWGIGYLSAPTRFDYILDVDGAAYWHPPLTNLYGTATYGHAVYA